MFWRKGKEEKESRGGKEKRKAKGKGEREHKGHGHRHSSHPKGRGKLQGIETGKKKEEQVEQKVEGSEHKQVERKPASSTGKKASQGDRAITIGEETLNFCSYSNDGKWLAVAGRWCVYLYDANSMELVRELGISAEKIAFHPNGLLIGAQDYELSLLDITQDKTRKLEILGGIGCFALDPSGRCLALTNISYGRNSTVTLMDVETNSKLQSFEGDTKFLSISFSHSGQYLAAGGIRGVINLWDLTSREKIRSFKTPQDIGSISFVSENTLASGSRDNIVRLWDVKTGNELKQLKGHLAPIKVIEVSSTGILASGDEQGIVLVWDTETGNMLHRFDLGTSGLVESVSFNPDVTRIAATAFYTDSVWVWHMQAPTDEAKPQEVEIEVMGAVNSVVVSIDGRHLVTGSDDDLVRFWDISEGRLLRRVSLKNCVVSCDPRGGYLVLGSNHGVLRMINTNSGQEKWISKGHDGYYICSLAVDLFSRYVASGGYKNKVFLWNLEDGSFVRCLSGHTRSIHKVTFDKTGKYLATASLDGTARLWDVESGKEIRQFGFYGRQSNEGILSVSINTKRNCLVIGTASYGNVISFDIESGRELQRFKGHEKDILCADFNNDGRYLVTGGSDSTVRLWDMETGKCLVTIEGFVGSVTGVDWGQTTIESFLITGDDRGIMCWRVIKEGPILTVEPYWTSYQQSKDLQVTQAKQTLIPEFLRPIQKDGVEEDFVREASVPLGRTPSPNPPSP